MNREQVAELYGEERAADLRLLVSLNRCFQSVSARLAGHIRSGNLTASRFDVMEVLYHGGPATVNEVIRKTLGSSGNTGVIIDNLIKSGMVEKQRDTQDRRVRRVTLTREGQSRMDDFFPAHAQEVCRTLKVLSAEEKEVLSGLLKKLGKSL